MASTQFLRPTLEELILRGQNDINSNIEGADARLRRSVLSVLSAVVSGQTHGLYGYQSYISKQAIIDTSDKESLEHWAKVWKIERKTATKSGGEVIFTGNEGETLDADLECRRGDGVIYIINDSAIVSGGTASTTIKAEDSGAAGNTAAGVKITLLSAVTGITSEGIVGAAGLTGGTDTESDEDLKARILDRIQEPPHGGADFDYKKWALEIPGVTRAWVYPREMGLGTVTIRFMMDNVYPGGVPLAADEQAVQAYIEDEERRPITAIVYAVAPLPIVIDINVEDLTPDTAEIRAAVIAELGDFIQREAEPGKDIPISKFWEAVATASGEISHKIVTPSDDRIMGTGEIAILGTVTFTESGA